jgi:hypothetical protein
VCRLLLRIILKMEGSSAALRQDDNPSAVQSEPGSDRILDLILVHENVVDPKSAEGNSL